MRHTLLGNQHIDSTTAGKRRRNETQLSTTNNSGTTTKRRRGLAAGIGGGVAALAVTALLTAGMFAPATGAKFSASGSGDATVKTGTLGVGLSDQHGNTGTFHLVADNVVPDDNGVSDTFTVKNTGSIPASVILTPSKAGDQGTGISKGGNAQAPEVQEIVNGQNGYSLNQLQYKVQGSFDWQPFVGGPDQSLGTLAPNETKTYQVFVRLDSNAGNDWQGIVATGVIKVTLNQQ